MDIDALLLSYREEMMERLQKWIRIPSVKGEAAPGAVVSGFRYGGREYRIISKSGGFGESGLIRSARQRAAEASTPR